VPSRVASHISLSSRFSLPPEPVTSARLTSMLVKDRDKVWHNPSLDQMIEALQVIMMANGVLAPIPLEYNPYILHLIEGFHDIQRKLDAVNGACDEVKSAQDQLSEDFKTVMNEWARREAQYKSEVKRLEILLAQMSYAGLETVTLARTNSVVDRGEPDPKQFISRLKSRGEALQHASSHEPESPTDNPGFPNQSGTGIVDSLGAQEWIKNMKWPSAESSNHKPIGTSIPVGASCSEWGSRLTIASPIAQHSRQEQRFPGQREDSIQPILQRSLESSIPAETPRSWPNTSSDKLDQRKVHPAHCRPKGGEEGVQGYPVHD
jgi:hypothetical protein